MWRGPSSTRAGGGSLSSTVTAGAGAIRRVSGPALTGQRLVGPIDFCKSITRRLLFLWSGLLGSNNVGVEFQCPALVRTLDNLGVSTGPLHPQNNEGVITCTVKVIFGVVTATPAVARRHIQASETAN